MRLGAVAARRLGDPQAAWAYEVRVPESSEARAEQEEQEGDALGTCLFAEQATHFYRQLRSRAPNSQEKGRLQSRIDDMKRKVRRLIRLAQEQTPEISVPYSPSDGELEAMLAPFLAVEPAQVMNLAERRVTKRLGHSAPCYRVEVGTDLGR